MNLNLERLDEQKRVGRKTRMAIAAFVALFSTFSCAVVLVHQPTWLATIAVSVEIAVVITFCHLMLRRD